MSARLCSAAGLAGRCLGRACRLVIWFALAGAAGLAMAAPPPIGQFFGPSQLGQVALSPDGRRVAMAVGTADGSTRLAVVELDTRAATVVAQFDEPRLGDFRWINHQRLVFNLNPKPIGPGRADTGPGLFAVQADGSRLRQLVQSQVPWVTTPEAGVPLLHWAHRLLPLQPPGLGDAVVVAAPRERSREKVDYFELSRLNTVTGKAQELDEVPVHSFDWLFDSRGELRVAFTRQDNRGRVLWRDAQGRWQTLAEFDPLHVPWQPRWIGPDDTLYVTADHQGWQALFTLDPVTRQRSAQPLLATPGFDVTPRFVVGRGKLLGVRTTVDAEITHWLDPEAKALQATIDALLPNTANRITPPREGDAPHVLVQSFADVQPMRAQVYDTAKRQLVLLGSSRPEVVPAHMGQTDFVRIRTRDGLDMPAYLTLPPGSSGSSGKQLPLVVLVHGGPWVRGAEWQWDAEVQFLATRGYAVLQPQFRGSAGFGRRWFEAGWKQWGRAMQADLEDAARWAIVRGTADAKRVALMGASYGGYATLMGLAQAPELFRCGVNWLGVTDIDLMYDVHWSDVSGEFKRYGMPTLIGDQTADAAALKAASPLHQAERIRQPLLMAYGGWDVRVPLVHGERFRDAVQPHNPQLEWVVYPSEGHGWRETATQQDFWGRVERFLARHLAAP